MKPEQGRLALALLNIALALAVVGLTYKTFFTASTPDPAEVPERIDPRQLEIRVAVQRSRADEYRAAWQSLDRPKPVEAPKPVEVPTGPPRPEDLGGMFQVVAVAIHGKDPNRSSVILQRRNAPATSADAQVQLGIGEKLENLYEVTKIEKSDERSVTITILDQGKRPCEIKFTAEK